MNALETLQKQFNSHVSLREKRPGIVQLVAPLFHEDGDMMDIFLDLPKNGVNGKTAHEEKIRVSDHGLTLMRLSYTFEIDTPNKDKIFHRILAENGVNEQNARQSVNGHFYSGKQTLGDLAFEHGRHENQTEACNHLQKTRACSFEPAGRPA